MSPLNPATGNNSIDTFAKAVSKHNQQFNEIKKHHKGATSKG